MKDLCLARIMKVLIAFFIFLSFHVDASIMKIAITDDRGIPFRESAPVQSKFTVLNSILGRLLYADSNYDLSPGHLESFKWDYSKRAYILKLKKKFIFS